MRRAKTLASIRRSNWTCSFTASSFHEDAVCNGLMIPDTSKGRLYTVSRGDHDKRENTQAAQIQFGI